jgi:predicted AAA+ superfamily ATPase
MDREYTSFLLDWKDRATRKPLIIRGARQVGKTYLVQDFARNFEVFIKINFEENPDYCEVFTKHDVRSILEIISLETGQKIIPNNTLLFLDEIQACPQAIPLLRYFYENIPDLHVIAAGSLLDHVLRKIQLPMPVGRVEFLYMHPMNFREFLTACGEVVLVDYLAALSVGSKIPEIIHKKLLKHLRIYFFVGGMPEAVRIYTETAELIEVERVHESILSSMEIDFAKYSASDDFEILRKVLRYLPRGIGKKMKYNAIDPSVKSNLIRQVVEKLELSRIIHRVLATSAVQVPLLQYASENTFKPLFLDIGLATHVLKIRLKELDNLMLINEGELAEQFIGQQLLTRHPFFINPELFYWMRAQSDSNAEIDYLLESGSSTIPLEVKAGKTGSLKSLHVFMHEYHKKLAVRFNADHPSLTDINTVVRMKNGNQSVDYQLLSLPLYMVNFLDAIISSLPENQ